MSTPIPAEVLEELMRACNDEVSLFHALEASDRTQLWLISRAARLPLNASGPTSGWSRGGTWDPQWREHCPVRAGSLWEQMELLLLADPASGCDYPRDGHEAWAVLGTLVGRANGRLR
jgi:hypothetical protein